MGYGISHTSHLRPSLLKSRFCCAYCWEGWCMLLKGSTYSFLRSSDLSLRGPAMGAEAIASSPRNYQFMCCCSMQSATITSVRFSSFNTFLAFFAFHYFVQSKFSRTCSLYPYARDTCHILTAAISEGYGGRSIREAPILAGFGTLFCHYITIP